MEKKKKFALELFCAWVLSIFPAMRYAVSLPFRFPPKTVVDFCVGLDFRFTMTTLGFVFVYLSDGIFHFCLCFFINFSVSEEMFFIRRVSGVFHAVYHVHVFNRLTSTSTMSINKRRRKVPNES